jgi:hypothetical protein
MAYTPPAGDAVNFAFEGGYSPPSGDGVNFIFNNERSKLRQQEQIRKSETYDDVVSDVNTSSTAEPTASGVGSLEEDLNIIRTLMKQVKNTTNWYDAPDYNIAELYNLVNAGVGEKYVEFASSAITKNVEHPLPNSLTYTPDSTAGQEGSNMDIFINGQLLAADTGVNGINADRDYGETSVSGITFRLNIPEGSNIVYVIRQ